MLKFRIRYLILTVVLFMTEVLIALYVHDSFVRPYVGDFLVVILVYCFLRSFFNLSVKRAAIAALLISYTVEILQGLNIISLLHLEHSKIAGVIMGTSFSVFDLLMYTAGIILVLYLEKLINNGAVIPHQVPPKH